MRSKEIKCPYCSKRTISESDEQVGEMLFNSKKECDNILTCPECENEFEVCLKVEYTFTTYKKEH